MKAKDDIESNEESQAFVVKSKKRKKGKFGKSKGKQDMSKIQCFGSNEYGHFKRDNKRKERSETHIVEEKGEPKKKPKGEDPKDLYY